MEKNLLFWPYLLSTRIGKALALSRLTRRLWSRVFLFALMPPLACILFSLPKPPLSALKAVAHPLSAEQLLLLSTIGIITALSACAHWVPKFALLLTGKSILKETGEKAWETVCESGDWTNFLTLVLWLPLAPVAAWVLWCGIDALPLARIALCVLLCGIALPILISGILIVVLALPRLFHQRVAIKGAFVFDPTDSQAGIGPFLQFILEILMLWASLSALTWFVGLLAIRRVQDVALGPLSGDWVYVSVLVLLSFEVVVAFGMFAAWTYGAWWVRSKLARESEKILEDVSSRWATATSEELLQTWIRLQLLRASGRSPGRAFARYSYAFVSFGGSVATLVTWIMRVG